MKGTRRLNRFRSKGFGKLHNNINKAVDSVMSTSGEVSSLVFAEHLLNLIEDPVSYTHLTLPTIPGV